MPPHHRLHPTFPSFRRPLPPRPVDAVEVRHPDLPAELEGLTILHLADLHARHARLPTCPSNRQERTVRIAAPLAWMASAVMWPLAPDVAAGQTINNASGTVACIRDGEGQSLPAVLIGQGLTGQAVLARGSSGATIRIYTAPTVPHGNFGGTVASVPDVDGDGRDDLVVGAHTAAWPGSPAYSGCAFVFSSASDEPWAVLRCPVEFYANNFGWAVAGVGDLDGDGRGDVMVASRNARVDVFSGATGAVLHSFIAPDIGPPSSLAGVPDVDGDGVPDLAIGCYEEPCSTVQGDEGRVHLFSGATFQPLRTICSTSGRPYPWFGYQIAGIQDVDGDGRGDLLVGAKSDRPPGATGSPGRLYVISGATGAVIHAIESPYPDQVWFGYVMAALPDIDSDGISDIAVGARAHALPGNPPETGAVYLFSGRTGQLLRSLGPAVPYNDGSSHSNSFGTNVAGAPDVTATRRGLLAVSTPGEIRTYIFPLCRADTDADGQITPSDVARFVNIWFRSIIAPPPQSPGDFDGDGAITPADISAFVTMWFATVVNGGC